MKNLNMNFYTLIYLFLIGISSWIFAVKGFIPEKIVNGFADQKNYIRYQVSVEVNGKPECGGAIIGSNFAITAVHCLFDLPTQSLVKNVISVVSTLNIFNSSMKVAQSFVHKIYYPKIYKLSLSGTGSIHNLPGDISVLKLDHELNLNDPRLDKLFIADTYFSHLRKTFIISGHGYNALQKLVDSNGNEIRVVVSDGLLRYSKSTAVSNHHCNELYNTIFHNSIMCAQTIQHDLEHPSGICLGDSGSPLVYNGKILVAILMAGPIYCSEKEKPAIYVRVAHYSKFIKNAMEERHTVDMQIATLTMDSSTFNIYYSEH